MVTSLTIFCDFIDLTAIRSLVERCNCITSSAIVIICHLSVTRVYCDKMAEVRIMQFSLKCSPVSYLCLPSLITKFEGDSLDLGPQTGVGWFLIDFATLYL